MYKEAKKSMDRLNELSLETSNEKESLYRLVETTKKELAEFIETYIRPNHNITFEVVGRFYKQDELIELHVLYHGSRVNVFFPMPNFEISLSEELSIDEQFAILKFLGYEVKELQRSKNV